MPLEWTRICLLLALLSPAGVWAQTCPTAADVAGLDFVVLPEGCVLPLPGFWYRTEAHKKTIKRLTGLSELVRQERAAKMTARAERDDSRAACKTQLESLRATLALVSSSLQACTEPLSRAVWAGIGAGAGVAVCVGAAILGSSLTTK